MHVASRGSIRPLVLEIVGGGSDPTHPHPPPGGRGYGNNPGGAGIRPAYKRKSSESSSVALAKKKNKKQKTFILMAEPSEIMTIEQDDASTAWSQQLKIKFSVTGYQRIRVLVCSGHKGTPVKVY